jgi:hypothetical protein
MRQLLKGAISLRPSAQDVDEVIEETARLIELLFVLGANPPVKAARGRYSKENVRHPSKELLSAACDHNFLLYFSIRSNC